MRQCNSCGQTLSIEQFAWKNKEKGLRNHKCKPCQKEYAARHYKVNADKYKTNAKASRPAIRNKNKQYLLEYLKNHPCVDCGIDDIRVLQFDHKEMVGSKARRVSQCIDSLKNLKLEIEKCDIRCANCHMIRTFEQMGWSRI